MPISFSCECGKRLKVADTLVGKKVKCPDCQKVTVVTAEAEPAKPAKAKPVAAPVKAKAAVKAPVSDEPDLSDLMGEVDAGLGSAAPAKKKPVKPAPAEEEPDLSSLLGDDEEEAPKPKKKVGKPPVEESEEPDLSSLLDDEEEAPKPAKKKGKPTLDENLEPDLSSLLGDDDEEAPKPGKKKSKSAEFDDDDLPSLEDDEDVPVKKGKKSAVEEEEGVTFDEDESREEGEEGDEGEEEEAPSRSKKKPAKAEKKGVSKLFLIIVAVVVLLGGAGATVFFVFPEWIGMVPTRRTQPIMKTVPPPSTNMMPPPSTMMMMPKKENKEPEKKESTTKDPEKKEPEKKEPEKKEPEKKDPEKKDPEKVSTDPNPTEKEIDNTLGMKLVRIEPGKFSMGSPADEKEREAMEDPHPIEITQPFYLGKFEVTQEQFQKIMETNPSKNKGEKLPVENVTWEEAKEFCRKLSEMEGRTYTLPTEAEWEFACRAGTKTPFSFGETLSTEQANYNGTLVYGAGKPGEFREKTTEVGMFPANAWGLHDMHGNVAEWCEDHFDRNYYKTNPKVDPKGPEFGEFRSVRGGSWNSGPAICRSAARFNEQEKRADETIGFRVVLRLPKTKAKETPTEKDDEPKKASRRSNSNEPGRFGSPAAFEEVFQPRINPEMHGKYKAVLPC